MQDILILGKILTIHFLNYDFNLSGQYVYIFLITYKSLQKNVQLKLKYENYLFFVEHDFMKLK